VNWSTPTADEHETVLRFIRRIRVSNIIASLFFFLFACACVTLGIAMIITDGNYYGITPVIFGLITAVVGLGVAVTDRNRYKKIKAQEYAVSRCRVVSSEVTRTRYSTGRYVSILCPNGNISRYKARAGVYRRAVEGASALLVDYSETHKGHRDISIDLVIGEAR